MIIHESLSDPTSVEAAALLLLSFSKEEDLLQWLILTAGTSARLLSPGGAPRSFTGF